ncbi:MAG: AEC family transporter [Betaproteobacteria bacterium]
MNAALLLLPDFLLIALGAALSRSRSFDAAFWSGLERLVYFVLFPALLFRSLAASPRGLADAGALALAGIGFTLAGMLLSALAQPLFRLPHPTFAACFQCAFRFNTYVALAAAARIGGAEGVATMSLLVGILVPVVNVAAVTMLVRGRGMGIVAAIARNPLVIACVAGIAWNALAPPLPTIASRILELLAAAALPLGLLAVGAGLKLSRSTLPLPALLWWHAVKLVAVPAVAFVLARVLGLSPLERQIAVALAAVSTAPSAYILAVQMGVNGAPVALLIAIGAVIAAATLPLWIALAA